VKPRLLSAVRAFQQPQSYSVVLFAFALGQIALLIRPSSRVLVLASLTLVILMVLWLFYGITEVDHEALILTGTWSIALLIAQRIVQVFPGTVDPLLASWAMKIFVAYHVVILALLVVLPLFLLSQALRSTARAFLHRIAPSLRWPFALVLLATCLGLAVSQVTGFGDIRVMFVRRASLLALTLVAGGLGSAIPLGTLPGVGSPVTDMSKRWYASLLGLICLGYMLLAARIQSDYINPDGYSYLAVARYYAEGHPVVRGYWSPLISWLIAPAVALGADPYAAFRVLTQLCGLAWILLTVSLGKRAGLGRLSRLALGCTMALITLTEYFYLVTPDLLSAAVVALYFVCLTHPRFLERPVRSGILIGLVGALTYYAKYYNFPFFLVHFPLSGFLLWTRDRRIRPVIRAIGSGLATFLFACLPWILALASRYGHLTISTSGAISHAVVGPDANGHPCWNGHLCDQPQDVLFPWEDPQPQYYASYGWSPFDSLQSFGYQVRLTWGNVSYWAGNTLFVLGAVPPLALLGLGLGSLVLWADLERRARFGLAFLTISLYAAGYMLTFAKDFRYYLPTVPILWITVYGMLERFVRGMSARWPVPKARLVSFVRVMLLVIPILSFSWLNALAQGLRYEGSYCLQQDSQGIASLLVPPTASADDLVNRIAYFARVRTLGVIPFVTHPSQADVILREMHVRTFLAPADSDLATALPSLYGYQLVGEARVCGSAFIVLRVPDG
jgi:4-amino-4-deoxy-L-arabinose transferase-like glycosyltransferase